MLVSGFPAGLKLSEEELLDKLEIFFGKAKNGGGDVEAREMLQGTVMLGFADEQGMGPAGEAGGQGARDWERKGLNDKGHPPLPVPHSGPAPVPDWPVHSVTGPTAGPSESLSLCEREDPESGGKWWVRPGKRLPAQHLPGEGSGPPNLNGLPSSLPGLPDPSHVFMRYSSFQPLPPTALYSNESLFPVFF